MSIGGGEDDSDKEADDIYDENDEGQAGRSDSDCSNLSELEEEIEVKPGEVVWGLRGRFWMYLYQCRSSRKYQKRIFKHLQQIHYLVAR